MIHKIKVDTETFEKIVNSSKRYVIRPDDRRYRAGDVLVYSEVSGVEYTGRERRKRVLLAVNDNEGVKEGCVILFVETTSKGTRKKPTKKEDYKKRKKKI